MIHSAEMQGFASQLEFQLEFKLANGRITTHLAPCTSFSKKRKVCYKMHGGVFKTHLSTVLQLSTESQACKSAFCGFTQISSPLRNAKPQTAGSVFKLETALFQYVPSCGRYQMMQIHSISGPLTAILLHTTRQSLHLPTLMHEEFAEEATCAA